MIKKENNATFIIFILEPTGRLCGAELEPGRSSHERTWSVLGLVDTVQYNTKSNPLANIVLCGRVIKAVIFSGECREASVVSLVRLNAPPALLQLGYGLRIGKPDYGRGALSIRGSCDPSHG